MNLINQSPVTRFWIGGRDDVRSTFGGWLWMGSNTSMHVGYMNWAPGFPRNMYSRMPFGTRCAEMKDGQWIDGPCDKLSKYVCELPNK